jgi:hypothetical protein
MTDPRDPRNNAPKTPRPSAGRPFQPGNAGRPKGARHKATLAAESLLDGEAESLTRKAVALAMAGDVTALRLCLERICPPRKDRPITIDLPPTPDAAGIAAAQQAVVEAASQGHLLLDEATALSGLLEGRRKALETEELEVRIQRIEERKT